VLVRQNAPVLGASDDLPSAGEWQVSLAYRGLESDRHYSGTEEQVHREELMTNVINRQMLLDLGITYSVSSRLSLSLGVPYVDASWSLPTPIAPEPGPRAQQDASGIGDLSLTGRYWLKDPATAGAWNVSLGLGVKAPTGDDHATDIYPDITGGNAVEKAVDQSVQLGDGGWGAILEVVAFRRIGPATLFATGSYLINPKDTNSTPSILVGLGVGGSPANADLLVNSVPDQYVARIGSTFPSGLEGLTLSLAGRIEGLPRYDLIGDSHGWRRPGYEVYVEPGLVYTKGRTSFSFHVPIGVQRNRQPNPYTGREGDATFPDYVTLASVSYRF
jgi:hypothetical protein